MFVGETFKREFIITTRVYEGFISTFLDRNPIHTSSKFAKSAGFLGPVMHGNILNGFCSYFVGECLPVKNVVITSQQISFKKPVYLDDTLILTVKIVEKHELFNLFDMQYNFSKQPENKKVANGKIQIKLLV